MQALLKKGLTVVLLAAIAAPVTAIPVAAERGAIADRDTRDRPTVWRAKPAVPAKHAAKQVANHRAQVRHAQTHKAKPHPAHANSHGTRHAVGHRFRGRDVVVVNNWRGRGLPPPGRDQVYVSDATGIYLAVAATLIVTALIN